jgi:hypothetical protein
MLFMMPLFMKSQTATATISNATACSGDTILVPVTVTDFVNVGAMTLYIGYDDASTEFISLENINPAIGGGMNVNASNGEVGIAYTNINGFTITNGVLFDLRYLLTGTATSLTFNPGTEIANINLEVIPLDTINGGISTGLTITEQPDSVQAYPDTDVSFTLLATGNNIGYQWEQNDGSGWQSLNNNSTYQGVTTDSLNIYDVTLSFDGYTYRCLLTSGNCDQYSDSALLEVALAFPVATIGQQTSCPEDSILIPLNVGDFFDVVEFTFNITFNQDVLEFISLENINPALLAGTLTAEPLGNPAGVSIHWEGTNPVSMSSATLFDLKFDYSNGTTPLVFSSGTQVINSLFNLVNITLTNGHVYQHEMPEILTQPESQTVKQNEEGIFEVEATGVNSYQWQVSMDGGFNWSDLTNAIPYYNTTTAELTISPVIWSLNNFYYACRLTGDFCESMTDAAVLSVDTLTGIGIERYTRTCMLQVTPNPASNIATLTFSADGPGAAEIVIFSPDGQLVARIKTHVNHFGLNQEILNLSGLSAGLYFIEVKQNGSIHPEPVRAKLLKSVN